MNTFAQRSGKERMWIVGGLLAGLVVALVGWLLLISPQRADTDAVNSDADAVRASNVELHSRISSLRAESKDMTAVKRWLDAAQHALPSTGGVPDFLRSLQSLGNSTGTDVVTLSVGTPTDVSSVAARSGTATSTTAPTNPGRTVPKGVYGLTISAQVDGPTERLDAFLDKLQTKQPRAVLITHITQGTADGPDTLQLTMQAFVAPSSAAEQAQLARATSR